MKTLNFKLISCLLFLAVGLAVLLPGRNWFFNNDSQLEQVKKRGELRVGTLNNAFSYYIGPNGPSGLEYELSKRFADYLGVELRIESAFTISDLFPAVNEKRIDMAAAGLLFNQERLSQFRVGPSYYSVSQQLVYRKGKTRPKTLNDIQGTLMVASGSAHAATLNRLKDEKYPNLQWQVTTDLSSDEILNKVANGELAYTIADSVAIAALQRVKPELAVAFDISDEDPVVWYMQKSKDDSLYAAMLDFMSNIVEDGTLARLEEKYFGHIDEFDYVDTRTFLAQIEKTLPQYQKLFEQYAGELDWRLLAAVAYQESHWNPDATSPTGVRGLMMLTRPTASSVGVNDRTDPEQSIRGGSDYLSRLLDKIPETIPEDERAWFALSAYNIGFGHMMDARRLTKLQGGNPDSWTDVKQRLPMLSQKRYYTQTRYGFARGGEAYRYVENIRRYTQSLVGYDQAQQLAMEAKQKEVAPLNDTGEVTVINSAKEASTQNAIQQEAMAELKSPNTSLITAKVKE
ncbi:MAG: membrane-bound lytic murein transglycosylase MltF [Plesiomonas sp.]|uniref:membrane-bound lytic murein transglycosylase MltF n=1 Tax=Plesiomonas sp. TaxID=2486279 RepID=UPI003F2E925F